MALLVQIEKKLGDFQLKVNFTAENGVMALLGASGSGKSMTLKCIAGIQRPDRGRIVLDGVTLFDAAQGVNVAPQKRRVGYLFQQYALFPQMTVEQNIACCVRDKRQKREMTKAMICSMNLEGMEKKKPCQLSGGQQQRVALARILVNEPEVLLLDEPFSALDSHLRIQMEREIQRILCKFGKTVILVSHNQEEVFRLTDSVGVMNGGKLEVVGQKRQIFANPETKTGAMLTGYTNISPIDRLNDHQIYAKAWGIKLNVSIETEEICYVGIRPQDLELKETMEENTVCCRVMEERENPFSYTLLVYPVEREEKAGLYLWVEKEFWENKRREILLVHFSSIKLVLLRE